MDLESKHFSMISPMPGNTPPPDPHYDQGNDLRVIENFLRQNNALGKNGIQNMNNNIPLPRSRVTSNSNPSGSGIRSPTDDKMTTQK